ncbi:hypothetical protein FVEN_g6253 [Fusarium venenatum]|uniref:DUF1772 domain-containing protein n=1 Tax=Fusarium venenatum TaxID=56646 RepID=A0A2L2TIS4_9HYPO|nr:uncharacterized protein FVRRES_01833 [Fusarium venenatum]KAG8356013.1 hypothetical protein FVEN_g6253 [Fusarium venenatum]KAH7005018.1 hypothetical protein EDB82DRAFT_521017 [Fusarium venenatum]CEI65321.1 unnamed protein product [Fusarium venenatum]
MPVSIPLPSLLASATGIAGSVWASGFIASLSLAGIPAALQLPAPSSTIVWHELFNRGFALMPKFAVTTTAAYFYAAYTAQKQGHAWKGLVVGAVSTVSIIPFTILFMKSTNELLFKAAAGTLEASQEDVAKLIGRWGFLNLVRSLIPLAGAVAGFSTLFQSL